MIFDRTIEAVIFDMDGVIIDSEPLHEEAQRIVFATYRLTVPPSVFEDYKGMIEEDVFAHIVQTYADAPLDPADLVAEKHRVYGMLMDRLQLVDGVRPFIEQLKRCGFPLGLTTSAIRRDQQRAFDLFDLHPFFDAIVTAEDVTRPKPAPEPYLTTAQRLGKAPSACLVVEDAINGVVSARRAGCSVAGLATSFSTEQLLEAGAHYAADTFDVLASYVYPETP